MSLTSWAPVAAAAAFVLFAMYTARRDASSVKGRWVVPAGLALAFLLFSLQAVFAEGPLVFWAEHTRNVWGNQIWFDLLLGIGIGWFFLVPQARAQGMRLVPWLVLIVCTGCIGLLAMLARLLYLQERSGR
jgi:hypothetical protein